VQTPADIADACACAAFDRILELRADSRSEIV
jgi:hypothetical protein